MSNGNKDVAGSASVSRHVIVGGNASVAGSMVVGHDMVISGWLDARNIKGPLKGLFASDTTLKEAYPVPRPGWFALVGSGLPADLWISTGGEWKATGKQGGELTLDLPLIKDDISALGSRLDEVESANTRQDAALKVQLGYISQMREELDNDVLHWRDRGASEGVAPLDEMGIVPEKNLPDLVYRREVDVSEGVAPLDEMGKVPEKNLPELVYQREVGVSEGVAPLDEMGQVPEEHLREVNAGIADIRKELKNDVLHWSDRDSSEGVAPLDETGIVPEKNLPELVYQREVGEPEGVAPLDEMGQVPEAHLGAGRLWVEVESEERLEEMAAAGELDDEKIYFVAEEE